MGLTRCLNQLQTWRQEMDGYAAVVEADLTVAAPDQLAEAADDVTPDG